MKKHSTLLTKRRVVHDDDDETEEGDFVLLSVEAMGINGEGQESEEPSSHRRWEDSARSTLGSFELLFPEKEAGGQRRAQKSELDNDSILDGQPKRMDWGYEGCIADGTAHGKESLHLPRKDPILPSTNAEDAETLATNSNSSIGVADETTFEWEEVASNVAIPHNRVTSVQDTKDAHQDQSKEVWKSPRRTSFSLNDTPYAVPSGKITERSSSDEPSPIRFGGKQEFGFVGIALATTLKPESQRNNIRRSSSLACRLHRQIRTRSAPESSDAFGPRTVFLYNALSIPEVLQQVLDLPGLPNMVAASVKGFKIAKWADDAILLATTSKDSVANGFVYEICSAEMYQKLKSYKERIWREMDCDITLVGGGKVKGICFK